MTASGFCLQIRMNVSAEVVAKLPRWQCPQNYRLRKVEPGDEVHLPDLLVSAGVGWSRFEAPKMIQYLKMPDRWDGSHVIESQGRLVALCFATRRDEFDLPWGQLDYVCVHPEHRGVGLGIGVCAGVLQYQRLRGYNASTLTTLMVTPENLQLAPIKMYLSLGFLPVMTEQNRTVCETVYQALGWPLPVTWWSADSPFDPMDDPDAMSS